MLWILLRIEITGTLSTGFRTVINCMGGQVLLGLRLSEHVLTCTEGRLTMVPEALSLRALRKLFGNCGWKC